MSVLTAHKILIATAIGLFFGYGVWEVLRYPFPGGSGALVRAGLSWLATVGLAAYLWYVIRRVAGAGRGTNPVRPEK